MPVKDPDVGLECVLQQGWRELERGDTNIEGVEEEYEEPFGERDGGLRQKERKG